MDREVEKAYEQLRTRKLETQEAIQKLATFSQKIMEWKREESEIGKNKYLLYEADTRAVAKLWDSTPFGC